MYLQDVHNCKLPSQPLFRDHYIISQLIDYPKIYQDCHLHAGQIDIPPQLLDTHLLFAKVIKFVIKIVSFL